MRALIVEDTPERQVILTRLLAEQDYMVVGSGQEALQVLAVHSFDVVFLDYDLADELTGADVAGALAELPDRPEVVVHSMNPDGVARIIRVLPAAHLLPIEQLHPRGAVFSRLEGLLAAGEAVDWGSCSGP